MNPTERMKAENEHKKLVEEAKNHPSINHPVT